MLKTLDGLIIADFSMFVAGPFATGILADLGAEVVKIEPLTGDPLRKNKVGPSVGGQSAQFQTFNHGKKSVTLENIKKNKTLGHLALIKQSRLSVMPIDSKSWKMIYNMGNI